MNLYLLPGSYENLEASIYKPVSPSLLEKLLGATKTNGIIQKIADRKIHCWAFCIGTRSNYDNMRENDVVLFKENKTESFGIKGRVADKVISESLGNNLWPISGGEPWKFIFFVKNIVNVSIPFSRLCKELGYERKNWLRGAIRVSDDHLSQAIRKFGNFDNFIAYLEGDTKVVPETKVIRRPGTVKPTQPMDIIRKEISTTLPEEDLWKI
jgi:hypothetical protein